MIASINTNGRFYAEADINRVAELLGVVVSDKAVLEELGLALEYAASSYYLALERKAADPPVPPSVAANQVRSARAAVEDAAAKLRRLPLPICSDLMRLANELGDKLGTRTGAKEYEEAVRGMGWIVGCLHVLQRNYENQKSKTGGNRANLARVRFYEDLNEITKAYGNRHLSFYTDRVTDEKTGTLLDFLNVAFSPFPVATSTASLAAAYQKQFATR